MKTTHLTRIALMLTLLILSAQFALPMGPIVISLQSLVILIIGLIMPKKQAALTAILYLITGLIGLPVFAQATGGPQAIFMPSFGFILSFIPAVYIMAAIRKQNVKHSINSDFLAVLVGNVIIYLIGMTYMYFVFTFYLKTPLTFWKVISIGMLPFVPGDIMKSIVALSIARQLNKHLKVDEIFE